MFMTAPPGGGSDIIYIPIHKGKKNYFTIAPATRSDHGIQYCSKQYTSLFIDSQANISTTSQPINYTHIKDPS